MDERCFAGPKLRCQVFSEGYKSRADRAAIESPGRVRIVGSQQTQSLSRSFVDSLPIKQTRPMGPSPGTTGLRREGVAERAGISIDRFIRCAKVRTVGSLNTTVNVLAKILHLDAQEHAYLRTLVGHAPTSSLVREPLPKMICDIVSGPRHPARIATPARLPAVGGSGSPHDQEHRV